MDINEFNNFISKIEILEKEIKNNIDFINFEEKLINKYDLQLDWFNDRYNSQLLWKIRNDIYTEQIYNILFKEIII